MFQGSHNPLTGVPSQKQLDNFYSKVGFDSISGCHPWTGAKGFHVDYPDDLTQAQPRWRYNDRTITSYRFAMFVELGYQDPGSTVDHLCHNRMCCNPLHLRCVPQIENNRNRRPVISDYCQKGHLRTPESVGINPTTDTRFCYVCQRASDKKRYAEKYAKEKLKNTHTSEMRDFAANPKLNAEKVYQILSEHCLQGVSGRALAKEYEVSQPMIRFILNGSSWKEIYAKFFDENKDIVV
jgi:hypothetical protein